MAYHDDLIAKLENERFEPACASMLAREAAVAIRLLRGQLEKLEAIADPRRHERHWLARENTEKYARGEGIMSWTKAVIDAVDFTIDRATSNEDGHDELPPKLSAAIVGLTNAYNYRPDRQVTGNLTPSTAGISDPSSEIDHENNLSPCKGDKL